MAHTCIVVSVNDDETNINRTSDNDSYLIINGESQETHDNNNVTATKISTGLFNSSEQNGGA